MPEENKLKYYIALFGAVFFWSSAFIASKAALTGIGPLSLSFLRILICFLLLLPFAFRKGFILRDLFKKNSFIYGIVGYGGNLVVLTLGLTACSAGISAIAHGLFPLFMVIFGYLFLNEKITKYKAIGIAFAVTGVMTASAGDLVQSAGSTALGIILVVISVLSWACYSVFAKKTAADMDALVLTELGFGTAVICFFPFALAEIVVTGFPSPDKFTLLCILYLSLMSGIFATILWNTGIKKVPAAISGIFFNLMPVIGLGFAIAAGEQTSSIQIIGCALVLVGVITGTRDKA